MVRKGSEFLTTYGDGYVWNHVVEVGLSRLVDDIREDFPNVEVDIPCKLSDLRASNLLHAWLLKMVWNVADGSCYHSTSDRCSLNTRDGLISYITSNVAFNRYAFRRCGLPEPIYGVERSENRSHVNNFTKALASILEAPVNVLFKRNERISTLRNNILNAKLIRTISTSVHTMEPRTLSAVILSHDFTSDPSNYEPPNGPLSSANYNSKAKVAMEVLKEVRELFPWIALRTRDWGVKDMLSVGNHLGG